MKVYNTKNLVQFDFEAAALTGDDLVTMLRHRIDKTLEVLPEAHIVFNFSNVEHLSSSFLGELVLSQMKITGSGGQLRLAHLHKNVHESLTIAGLAGNFQIHDTLRTAVKSFEVE